jgi:hypothetical protein
MTRHVSYVVILSHAFKEDSMMQQALIAMVAFLVTTSAFATTPFETIRAISAKSFAGRALLNWTVGDNANYNVNMGFVQGTMTMTVTTVTTDELWITQDMNLGFLGQQKSETVIDPNTGKIIKVLVNGQEQQLPEQDLELIEIIDDTVTVPAGTFECQHIRLKDNKSGDEIKVWSNATVALSGMVKTIQPGQFGEVTVELTSFLKQ